MHVTAVEQCADTPRERPSRSAGTGIAPCSGQFTPCSRPIVSLFCNLRVGRKSLKSRMNSRRKALSGTRLYFFGASSFLGRLAGEERRDLFQEARQLDRLGVVVIASRRDRSVAVACHRMGR